MCLFRHQDQLSFSLDGAKVRGRDGGIIDQPAKD